MIDLTFGHYTTLTGLLGIIKSGSLWATNVKFLNDEYEFQHALNLIKDIIPKSKITSIHPDHAVHQEYISEISEKLESLDNYRSDLVFTLSFSEETDLLSQWRGYCPGNNGYCITFDINKLHEKAKSIFDDCHVFKCVYDDKQKERQLKKLLNDYWGRYFKLNDKKSRKSIIDDLAREIMLLASYFKHPSFEEEKEHRIVILLEYDSNNDLKFREGRFSLVPYVEIPAPRDAIKEICIGPTGNKGLARRALEAFLEKHYGLPVFLTDIGIEFSKSPYRSW